MDKQLSLPFQVTSFFPSDWVPIEGEEATICTAVAEENLFGGGVYCMFEDVIVVKVDKPFAIVESSDKWIQQLREAGWRNPKKKTLRVYIQDLQPADRFPS